MTQLFKKTLYLIGLSISLIFFSQQAIAQGALLPEHRIVGYYGNFNSTHMGVLGEYPPDVMLGMLNKEVEKWKAADPSKKVIPAIDYITVVAEADAGRDGKYRARMSGEQIQKAINMANQINGIAILDIQVALSSVQDEVPLLAQYLQLPNVMLALDPEFAMAGAGNVPPGKRIGSLDAKDINYAIDFLANIVRTHNLPPKVLVIHRFTEHMITNYKNIKVVPEVQVVINMDGWGSKEKKRGTYNAFIAPEVVEYTGVKLFYKNDLKAPSTGLLTPEEILNLKPQPMFILYQ